MGYQLGTYSTKEIKELINEDKIMPSLFWVFPIGRGWKNHELEQIYSTFNDTQNRSIYQYLGNFFVKDLNLVKFDKKKKSSRFESVESTEEINDLLERFNNKVGKSLMILTSNFPMPGWGIVVKITDVNDFLLNLNSLLTKDVFKPLVDLSFEIYPSYLELQKIKKNIPLEPKNNKLKLAESVISSIRQLKKNKNDGLVLKSVLSKLQIFDDEQYTSLKKFQAYLLFKNSPLIVQELIERYLDKILNKEFDDLNEELGPSYIKIFKAFKFIPKDEVAILSKNIENWISNTEKEYDKFFEKLFDEIELKRSNILREANDENIRFKNLKESWQQNLILHNPRHISMVSNFIEKVMELSPIFLIELEKKFKQNLIICPWDDVRMIGWKTSKCVDSQTDTLSFAIYLNEQFNAEIEESDIDHHETLNGDVFTDYIHYILFKDKSKFGDRRKLVEKVLSYFRQRERMQILKNLDIQKNESNDLSEFLHLLGWGKPTHVEYDTSLVSFFKKDGTRYILSNPKRETWNSLRISMESYLKDLIKIISKNLPYKSKEIQEIVRLKFNDFNFDFPSNWEKEFSHPTIFPASIIIFALGEQWKSELNWKVFHEIISKISNRLNPDSHFHEIIKIEDEIAKELNPLFNNLFEVSKEIFQIMPWHFKPNSKIFSNPAIYCGMAWSHDHFEKKEIRILAWESECEIELNKEILVWNPSKINPIMTNYKIL